MRDGGDSGNGRWKRLDDFLRTDPRDPGCSTCRHDIDTYAELTVNRGAPASRFPGVTAHLESCADCRDDLKGLISALSDITD